MGTGQFVIGGKLVDLKSSVWGFRLWLLLERIVAQITVRAYAHLYRFRQPRWKALLPSCCFVASKNKHLTTLLSSNPRRRPLFFVRRLRRLLVFTGILSEASAGQMG